jgi:hypothetical protein
MQLCCGQLHPSKERQRKLAKVLDNKMETAKVKDGIDEDYHGGFCVVV